MKVLCELQAIAEEYFSINGRVKINVSFSNNKKFLWLEMQSNLFTTITPWEIENFFIRTKTLIQYQSDWKATIIDCDIDKKLKLVFPINNDLQKYS
ncbi:hypothetical protein [Elizabethkingia anophelis]|uniref:hypothetical protein n=1 Tax=Elizabethkingia anophelis TaxID=1117645 RepID=UPI003F1BA340